MASMMKINAILWCTAKTQQKMLAASHEIPLYSRDKLFQLTATGYCWWCSINKAFDYDFLIKTTWDRWSQILERAGTENVTCENSVWCQFSQAQGRISEADGGVAIERFHLWFHLLGRFPSRRKKVEDWKEDKGWQRSRSRKPELLITLRSLTSPLLFLNWLPVSALMSSAFVGLNYMFYPSSCFVPK